MLWLWAFIGGLIGTNFMDFAVSLLTRAGISSGLEGPLGRWGWAFRVANSSLMVRRENAPKMRDIRKSFLGEHRPAHTLLFISGLAYPELLIEVEGIAAKD